MGPLYSPAVAAKVVKIKDLFYICIEKGCLNRQGRKV